MKLMWEGGTSEVEVDLGFEGGGDLLGRRCDMVSATGKEAGQVIGMRMRVVGVGRAGRWWGKDAEREEPVRQS